MHRTLHLALASLAALALACALPGAGRAAPAAAADTARAADWTDAEGRANRRIAANGTTLHVVDHGGHGPALVFLAGLGNSAHVFDDFAARFTDRAHVYAFTRRGYGESGRPKEGYDTATLAEDVRALLDSLGIDRAVLIGHSVAGDELTEVAARHPARVAGLVYLEAAYDRSHTTRRIVNMAVLRWAPPAPPGPGGKDRASLEAARDYCERLYGVRWPRSEVAATRGFDARGRWTKDATPASTNAKIVFGEIAPRFAEVRAPVLAIYAVNRPESRDFAWLQHVWIGRGAARLRAMRYRAVQNRWEADERRKFAAALPAARIVELPGASHYVFLSDGGRVEREMRDFLDALGRPAEPGPGGGTTAATTR